MRGQLHIEPVDFFYISPKPVSKHLEIMGEFEGSGGEIRASVLNYDHI